MSQFMTDFLAANEDIDEDTAKQLRDTAAAILAGLDQMRSSLGMKMGDVPWPRLGQLADRLAVETVDYSPLEGALVGSWMAASARAQLQQRDDEGDPGYGYA